MAVELTAPAPEQTRACYPDESGYVERDGVRLHYVRFTERLIARQRELYAADEPFVEKWRTAMRFLVSEDATYEKIWLELQALAWNKPGLRARLAEVNAEWRAVLTEAFAAPHRELGLPIPLDALVSLVMTFNLGIMVERLGGVETGHADLLDWIDAWLST